MRIRDYKKPSLPPLGIPWFLVQLATGFWDGPFYTDAVEQSTGPNRPWGIMGGSPRVLRLKRQEGNLLVLEDGEFKVTVPPDAAPFPGIESWR